MSLLKFQKQNRQIAYAPPVPYTMTVDKNGYIGDKYPADGYTHYCFKEVISDYSQSGLGQVNLLKWTTIGDKEYVTGIMPDGREWMCQNLDYVDANAGIIVGTNCWYYSNDQATYGWNGKKYGLLYTWNAAMSVNIKGWHLPTKDEFDTFVTALGSNSGTKAKSTYDWSSGAGTDNFGFNVVPAGHRNTSGSSQDLGNYAFLWSSTEFSSSSAYRCYLNADSAIVQGNLSKSFGLSVRLVKDT